MTSMDPIRERAERIINKDTAYGGGLSVEDAKTLADDLLDALDKVERLEKLAVPVTTQQLAEAAQHIARIGDEARKHYEKCLELEADVVKLTEHRQAMIDAAMSQSERANGYGEIVAKVEAERDQARAHSLEFADAADEAQNQRDKALAERDELRVHAEALAEAWLFKKDDATAYLSYRVRFGRPATQTKGE